MAQQRVSADSSPPALPPKQKSLETQRRPTIKSTHTEILNSNCSGSHKSEMVACTCLERTPRPVGRGRCSFVMSFSDFTTLFSVPGFFEKNAHPIFLRSLPPCPPISMLLESAPLTTVRPRMYAVKGRHLNIEIGRCGGR